MTTLHDTGAEHPEVLSQAIKAVTELETPSDDWIDGVLEQRRKRKRTRRNDEELREDVQREFLTPSGLEGGEWLNRLQQ